MELDDWKNGVYRSIGVSVIREELIFGIMEWWKADMNIRTTT